jgi:dienelactone hydrolase
MNQDTPTALEAHPVHFERDRRTLVGWFHPAATTDGQTRDCLVVMCNPLGYDAICTHRHYRQLALRLAAAGFAVLRYDHHGTGDSAGTDEMPHRIESWLSGVGDAVDFGRRLSGAGRVSLFGVRMGGTLALAAAATVAPAQFADSIVAWAPFSSGNLYLRETRALRLLRGAGETHPAPVVEADENMGEESGGYLLTAESIAAMAEIDLSTLTTADNLAPRAVLLMSRDDIPHNEKLTRHLRKIGCAVDTTDVPGYGAMMRDTFDAVVPDAALAEIREWLETRHPLVASAPAPLLPMSESYPVDADGGRATVNEKPVRFGSHHNLFGILGTPAEPQPQRSRTAVIFVNTGSNHHIGPNRMYVTFARMLAARGFTTLRMDIGGVGDSPASPGQRDNQIFARHTLVEIHAAVAWLKTMGVSKVVLTGVCSGAYLAFRSAVGEPAVNSVVMINPQRFNWREGESLALRRRKDIRSLRFYRARLMDGATWKRVLRGEVNVRWIASGISNLLRQRVVNRLSAVFSHKPKVVAPLEDMAYSTDVHGLFRGLLQREVRVFLLFSANDGGLDEVETHLGANASRLRRQKHFRFEVVDGADHTFTPIWAQKKLGDLLVEHVVGVDG